MDSEVNKAWLESILVKHQFDKSIQRVCSAECGALVESGENYSSQMIRVSMDVILGSGATVKKSVIVKKLPESKLQVKLIKETFYFKNEIEVYTVVLPLMERLQMENGDKNVNLWADCIDSTPYSELVLEDLREKGYIMMDRKKGLDLEHADIVLKSLGRFHALGHILLMRGLLSPQSLNPNVVCKNLPVVNDFFKGAAQHVIPEMRSWHPKWVKAADKFESLLDDLGSTLANLGKQDDKFFQTINHGDCWMNNMMFQHCLYSGKPLSVRFIDFQSASHCSIGWDLTYFLVSSLACGVRKNNLDKLLTAYLDSLNRTLHFYGVLPENIPSKEDLKGELNRLLFYALLVTCCLVPLRNADKAMDFEKVIDETCDNKTAFEPNMFSNKESIKLIQDDLEQYMEAGII